MCRGYAIRWLDDMTGNVVWFNYGLQNQDLPALKERSYWEQDMEGVARDGKESR